MFPQVVVVEASAGSGKTYHLAKRYLWLLINPQNRNGTICLRNILAITFTNKATVEMKERILEFLKKIALDAFSDKEEEEDILSLLSVSKKEAQAKAANIMREIIKNYNFFQVQTIDSFINALLLGSALNIERSAGFQIKRDYTEHLSYCLDLVIDQAQSDGEILGLLQEFLQHYLFVENRKGWFPKEDIRKLMNVLFSLTNKYGKVFEVFKGGPESLIKKKKYIFNQIEKLQDKFPDGLNASAKKYIGLFLVKSEPIFDISAIPSSLKSPEVPMNKDKNLSSDFERAWERVYESLRELVELDALSAYNPYIKLFNKLDSFFQLVSKKKDLIFLEELNRKARFLFGPEGITVSEIYYRLASRFGHYLIDEFQDTSVLQWRNLELMVGDALSSGGSLFYVGDKKQAIYRFRGGDAKLFDKVQDDFTQFNVEPYCLDKNWRSQKAIVDFNNEVFSKENLKHSIKSSDIREESSDGKNAIDEILDIFKDAHQKYKEGNNYGYVQVERIKEKNTQERNEIIQPKIINLIKDLRSRFDLKDIALLARDNGEVELLTSWCVEAGFSVESEKTLNVIENSLIKEIICLLKFLHSPIDNLSFAAFIMGGLFSRAACKDKNEIIDFIFNLRKEKELNRHTQLYSLFRKKYEKLWEKYFDELFRCVGFISSYELTVRVYQRFAVLENFKEYQAFFMKFLELIKTKESEYISLGEFLSYLDNAALDDLYVKHVRSDSLKILTIHKAKGLEFGVVVIPFLRMEVNPSAGSRGMNSFLVEAQNEHLQLLRITKNHCVYSPILKKVYAENYKQAFIDELNNIYVALTRAQFELYIFIPNRSAAMNNKAGALIPAQITKQGAKRKYDIKKEPILSNIDIEPSPFANWLGLLGNEVPAQSEIQNRERILEGNILHAMLSVIGNCLDKDITKIINEAANYIRVQFPSEQSLLYYQDKIKELLGKKELKCIFCILDGQVMCEKEVVTKSGDLKRIDRLILKEKEALVIDYKSSQDAATKQKEQLIEYMQIIKEIYPNHKIKGCLVYLDEMKLEYVGPRKMWGHYKK